MEPSKPSISRSAVFFVIKSTKALGGQSFKERVKTAIYFHLGEQDLYPNIAKE
jgi:hypothetical protein